MDKKELESFLNKLWSKSQKESECPDCGVDFDEPFGASQIINACYEQFGFIVKFDGHANCFYVL